MIIIFTNKLLYFRYAKCNFSISFPVDYIEKDKNNDNNNNNNEIKKEKQILIEEFKMDSIEETVDERGNRVFKVKPDTKVRSLLSYKIIFNYYYY